MNPTRVLLVGRREWAIAFLIALVAVALTMIPYALGYILVRPGLTFTGVLMNPEDSQSYFAKMLEGYHGEWLYTIPFTVEDHSPAFVGGFYLALGHLARTLGLSLELMWQLARALADLALFVATFVFIACFVSERSIRWTAYLLAVFGSGLGWLLFLINQPYWLDAFPVDFKMPEAHLFFSALTYPHVALGTTLILSSIWAIGQTSRARGAWKPALLLGLSNVGVGIVYPFLIYLVASSAALYWLYRCWHAHRVLWRQALWIGLGFVIAAPLFLQYAATLLTNPVFRAWDAQAVTPSPALPHYIIAYGVMLALAGLAFVRWGPREHALLWSWIVAAALLVYAPLNPQRRFVQGVQVPLAILAAVGLFQVVLPWLEGTRLFRTLAGRPGYSAMGIRRLFVVSFLFFMAISNVYILVSLAVTMGLQQPYPLFRGDTEVASVEWLHANTPRTAIVLGGYESGNYVAARAGNRVVVGHWAETVDYANKLDAVKRFFNTATDDSWRTAWLTNSRVQYLFFGPHERELGAFDPGRANYLEPVYSNSDVTIYRVKQ